MEIETEQKSNGATIGLIIIIIILVIGGIYLWKNSQRERTILESNVGTNLDDSSEESIIDLEANLNNLDLESLDSEI